MGTRGSWMSFRLPDVPDVPVLARVLLEPSKELRRVLKGFRLKSKRSHCLKEPLLEDRILKMDAALDWSLHWSLHVLHCFAPLRVSLKRTSNAKLQMLKLLKSKCLSFSAIFSY